MELCRRVRVFDAFALQGGYAFPAPMQKRTSKCTQSKVGIRTIAVLHQIQTEPLAGSMAKSKYFVAPSVGAIDEVLSLTFIVSSIVSHSVY